MLALMYPVLRLLLLLLLSHIAYQEWEDTRRNRLVVDAEADFL